MGHHCSRPMDISVPCLHFRLLVGWNSTLIPFRKLSQSFYRHIGKLLCLADHLSRQRCQRAAPGNCRRMGHRAGGSCLVEDGKEIENGEWEAYNQSRAPSSVWCAARDKTGAIALALPQGHQFTGGSPWTLYVFALCSLVFPSSAF